MVIWLENLEIFIRYSTTLIEISRSTNQINFGARPHPDLLAQEIIYAETRSNSLYHPKKHLTPLYSYSQYSLFCTLYIKKRILSQLLYSNTPYLSLQFIMESEYVDVSIYYA
jgi:hypothetical protein